MAVNPQALETTNGGANFLNRQPAECDRPRTGPLAAAAVASEMLRRGRWRQVVAVVAAAAAAAGGE